MKRLPPICLILWLLLTCMSNTTVLHAQTATASPTPYPGNTVVNVSPGNGSISAAVNAHGANTTYRLANGSYTDSSINSALNHVQFIGSGPANVKITCNTTNVNVFDNEGTSDFFQVWGMTIDLNNTYNASISGNFSNLLFQNIHVQNYCSNHSGQELFPVYLFATGYSPNNELIDSCRFTPSSSGNVDGTSVIATGAFRPDGSNYANITVSNCIFDTPTDTGTGYYHCVGQCQTVTGCTFVAPNFTNGDFWYTEPGSWNGDASVFQDDSDKTFTLTGNTITLTPNFSFVGGQCHANGRTGSFIITGNTIHGAGSSEWVVDCWPGSAGCSSEPLSMKAATIQYNTLDTGLVLVNDRCTIGTIVDSPNTGP